MGINKNHEFEELNGIKCAIVEKNISQERVDFLERLLAFNKYTVVVVPSPPPKAAAPPQVAPAADEGIPTASVPEPEAQALPSLFNLGVTDVTFNSINAIFGRMLLTPDGHIVTLAYWQQEEATSKDEVPYFEKK